MKKPVLLSRELRESRAISFAVVPVVVVVVPVALALTNPSGAWKKTACVLRARPSPRLPVLV